MDNQIYRISLTDGAVVEFYVCGTNELEPYRAIKELGIVVLKGDTQLDGELNLSELDSLIKYLEDCRDHIKDFNAKSLPKTEI
jgi:hypothetical protein